MTGLTWVELAKQKMKFAAGHFTIFSKTERERLHGHNFFVAVTLGTRVPETGISFDYAVYKDKLVAWCRALHEYFLLPEQSPYLHIEEEGAYYRVTFHEDVLLFLKKDVLLLPLSNITVEMLAQWFLSRLLEAPEELVQFGIDALKVTVSSSPGQSASVTWER